MKQIVTLVFFIQTIYGSNVLFISDVPSPSHQIWNYEISAALVAKGHNVTVIGPSPHKGHGQKNYHIIDVKGLTEDIHAEFDLIELMEKNTFNNLAAYFDWGFFICNYTLNSEGLKFLLNYPNDFKFDLILVETTCITCLLPLIQHFQYPPTVAVSSFLLPPYLSQVFGNDIQPSYLPFHVLQYNENPTFFQRLQHYFWYKLDMVLREIYLKPSLEEMARGRFGKDMDSFETLDNHISLLLCNLIQGYHYPQPLTPNIIPVGGLHINPAKELSEDIKKIMDNAKDGVILFSLGTNIQSSSIKEDRKTVLLKALGQLKQTVLWKFEKDLDHVPDNVIIRKWWPQRNILAHPNVKLFISHGGALSTIEASYFGVPVLGIPFIVDQMSNIQLMVNKKIALSENFLDMTSTTLLTKINDLLHNPMYAVNAKKQSKIIQDQPESPINRAIFWLEYTIRHNGTHFLDPASRHLPLFVSSSMDILLFILFVLVAWVIVLFKCVSLMKHRFRVNSSGKLKKK